jgi:exosortase
MHLTGRVILIALGALWVGMLYELYLMWGTSSDYSDRYVIVLGSLFLLHRNRNAIAKEPVVPQPALGLPVVLACGLLLVPGWYIASQAIVINILVSLLTVLSVGITLGAVLAAWGWPRLKWIVFPVFFVLFALPLPDPILLPLRTFLQKLATHFSTMLFRGAGFDVATQGFEIHLPSGPLEVVEACSGIRSLTALTAIAAFVAYYRGMGWFKGLLLFSCSLPVVFLCNSLRIFFTGLLQEKAGREYTQGYYHDALGGVMVLLGMGLLLLISELLCKKKPAEVAATETPLPLWDAKPRYLQAGMLALIAAACVGVGAYGYSLVNFKEQQFDVAKLSKTIGNWQAEELPIDVYVFAGVRIAFSTLPVVLRVTLSGSLSPKKC